MINKRARVLLVDDEPLILSSYRRALRNVDADIELADDPLLALESLKRAAADVIVADYRMPGMNGDELLEQVRNKWPDTVRVLVTAYTDVQMIEDVVRRGEVFRFLTKPCDTRKFRAAIVEALEQNQRLQANQQQTRQRNLDLDSYLHLFEGAFDPMMFADLDGNLVRVNPAFVNKHGEDKRDALRNRPSLLAGLSSDGRTWRQVKGDLDTHGVWSGEINRNGYIALLSVARINDENGEPYAYAAVEKDVSEQRALEQQSRAAQYEVILALAKLAEYRDPETGAHLERMRRYSQILTRELGNLPKWSWIDEDYVEAIFYSSPLHDIGKVGIADAVLLKPGKLTREEWEDMKRHTLIGAEVLSAAGATLSKKTWLSLARTIALEHHEKFDGSGYPHGLEGERIDPAARIVALADAYDAITSKRVYKEAVPHEEARERLITSSGSHFDPDVVDAFLRAESLFIQTKERFNDEDLALEGHFTLRSAI
jgi:response regulator RpfG family c-di-GMP phosphodiesterase